MFTVCMCVQCVTCVDVYACCVPLHVVVGLYLTSKYPQDLPLYQLLMQVVSMSICTKDYGRCYSVSLCEWCMYGVHAWSLWYVCDVCVHVIVCVWVIHML